MEILRTVSDLRAFMPPIRRQGRTLGFVPTMGAFHEGHLALMRQAKSECDVAVVSLFVNPTQFSTGEDFARYPRDLERDSEMAESAEVDALFAPDAAEIYPLGPSITVEVAELTNRWEGERRPGHFTGVATVCAMLFNIVQPDRSYFGQKDYQQLKVIQRMVGALHFPTTIVPVPTVRESDGLAMSSRNAYLSPPERSAAPALFRALRTAADLFEAGERDANTIERTARWVLAEEELIREDYLGVADSETLEPVETVDKTAVLLLAVHLGSARLIDNIVLESAD